MKYTDLSDKERYEVIKLGVQNGMTNLDDIEKAYNEYAEGGYIFEGYGNSSLNANFGQGFLPSTEMTIGQIKGLSHSVAETKRQEELKKAQLDYDRNKIEWNEIDDSTNPMDIIKYAGKRPETYADLQKKQKYEDDAKAFTKGALDLVTLPYSVAKSAPMLAKAAWGAYNAYGIGTGIYEGITEKDEQPQQSNIEIEDPYTNKDVKIPLIQDIQQTVIAKTNPSIITKPTITPATDTRVKVRTPQQTTIQATQPAQQQAVVQKSNKMQGFMNKLGSAAPYIGDFVGWTLGNSKFFNYGGNIYEIKG